MGVLVRTATAEDVAALAALELTCFPDDAWLAGYLAEGVAGRLSGPAAQLVVLVAVDDADADAGRGAVVGHAILSVVFEVAELQRIGVLPGHRRAGVADALLGAVSSVAAAAGAERLLLEVRENNAAARALYERTGFAEIDRRERYYRDGSTAVVLERSVRQGMQSS